MKELLSQLLFIFNTLKQSQNIAISRESPASGILRFPTPQLTSLFFSLLVKKTNKGSNSSENGAISIKPKLKNCNYHR
jgi:hypothetical protein